jgi:hypothetical protein
MPEQTFSFAVLHVIPRPSELIMHSRFTLASLVLTVALAPSFAEAQPYRGSWDYGPRYY